jgi:hypothetical protein
MGIGDAYLGLVDLLSLNGTVASSKLRLMTLLLTLQKTAPNVVASWSV